MRRNSRPFCSLGLRRPCGVRRASHPTLTDLQRHLEVSGDHEVEENREPDRRLDWESGIQGTRAPVGRSRPPHQNRTYSSSS
jgi:hypothetical protein